MTDIPTGMTPWHGGVKPADWTGEAVQFRSGRIGRAVPGVVWKLGWDHSYGPGDIIAYTRTAPAVALDEGDWVLVPRVPTEAMCEAGWPLVPDSIADAFTAMCDACPPSPTDENADLATIAYMMGAKDERDRLGAPSAPISERERGLVEALQRIESGEAVRDWADQPHEQMQEAARTALACFDQGRG